MSDDPASAEAFRPELEQTIQRLMKTRDALTEERDELVRISNKLIRERDEARQRYCFAMAEHGEEAEARQNAKDEGWDCFKENTNG